MTDPAPPAADRRPSGPPVVPRPAGRRLPELPFGVVVASLAGGLVTVYLHHFRIGAAVVAGSVLLGAALRLVLPPRRAGLLVVRSRGLDVVLLTALGLAVLGLALVVPRST